MDVAIIGLLSLAGVVQQRKKNKIDHQQYFEQNYLDVLREKEQELIEGKESNPTAIPDVWNLAYTPEHMQGIFNQSFTTPEMLQTPGIPSPENVVLPDGPLGTQDWARSSGKYGKGFDVNIEDDRVNRSDGYDYRRPKTVLVNEHPTNRQITWGQPMPNRELEESYVVGSKYKTHEQEGFNDIRQQEGATYRPILQPRTERETEYFSTNARRPLHMPKNGVSEIRMNTGTALTSERGTVGVNTNLRPERGFVPESDMTYLMTPTNVEGPMVSEQTRVRNDNNHPNPHPYQVVAPTRLRGRVQDSISTRRGRTSIQATLDTPGYSDQLTRNTQNTMIPLDNFALHDKRPAPRTRKERGLVIDHTFNGHAGYEAQPFIDRSSYIKQDYEGREGLARMPGGVNQSIQPGDIGMQTMEPRREEQPRMMAAPTRREVIQDRQFGYMQKTGNVQ